MIQLMMQMNIEGSLVLSPSTSLSAAAMCGSHYLRDHTAVRLTQRGASQGKGEHSQHF